ncbi:MAG: Bug family tripartite tricarboxylate transporter substrate binding protein [Pseudorhodoplanes sp.]|uniref:Bug family tripartite tricarboxylate transporter substrate binding protein n=1 Tax=Pseudorhodoplanes sp. TaxID=1934341 RepID=UPI003D124F0C
MIRTFVLVVTAAMITTSLAVPPAVAADDYPTKAVTMIVPFPAGGRTDLIGRIIAQYMQTPMGKPVSIVNKPGASSVLGSNEVAESKPDGYMLGFFSTAAVTAQYTVPTPLDLSRFELVAIVNADPAALAVNDAAKWQTLKELIADAKKTPGSLKIGMIPGASAQIFAAGFARAAGVDLISVPFKGDSDGAIALAGGHIDIHVAVPVSYKSLVASKKVRVLAVASDARSDLYGNLPTYRENGVPLSINAFHGVYVPKGTPEPVKAKIAAALKTTMANPELQKRMNDAGAAGVFLVGDEAKAYLKAQDETYRDIIDALGLRAKPSK